MDRNGVIDVLRLRRALTGDTYNELTVDAWHTVFAHNDYDQVHTALVEAAKDQRHVAVADVVARLHRAPDPWAPPPTEGEVVAMHEWLARLQRRADTGDRQAQSELGALRRHPHTRRLLHLQQPDTPE